MVKGRKFEEISAELDIPVNTIGPVLSRAKKKLRAGAAPDGTSKPTAAGTVKPGGAG